MTRPRIEIPEAALAALCRRWKIGELAVFGSAPRDDFALGSDVDMLVRFAPDAEWSLLDHAQMQDELGELLGRRVDLVSRRGLEGSRNYRDAGSRDAGSTIPTIPRRNGVYLPILMKGIVVVP